MLDEKQRYYLPLQHHNLPQENIIPRRKLLHQKDKQDPALNSPPPKSTIMKLLSALFMIKVFPQGDIRRNIYFTRLDFIMTKVPKRGCYKTLSSSIVITNGRKAFVK